GRDWFLASGGLDASVVFWQQSGKGRKVPIAPDFSEDSAAAGGAQLLNPPFVHSLAYFPDGSLAAGLGDGTIALLEGSKEKKRLRGHAAAVAQVVCTPAGLISAGNDLQVMLWSGKEMATRWQHPEKMNWLAFAEQSLCVADVSNEISLYEGFV
ncbi:unnamed protein product, partial [Effrenium voratum]